MQTKEARIELRTTPADKNLLRNAAKASNLTISQFILLHACQQASQVLAEQRVFTVNQHVWQAMQEALSAPPKTLPAMQDLLNRNGILDES